MLEMVRDDADKAVAWLKEHAESYRPQFVTDDTAAGTATAKVASVMEVDADDEAILEGLVESKDEKESLCAKSCAVETKAASAGDGDGDADLASQVRAIV